MKLYSDEELAEILDKKIFHQISQAADNLGLECYVVGGYVRDIFLERPSNDIDVVVVGSGLDVAREFKRIVEEAPLTPPLRGDERPKSHRPKVHLSQFANFGTAQVKIPAALCDGFLAPSPKGEGRGGALEVEFVGARKESYSHDSRKPIVENGTLEDDQNRRDFTINAMAICLNADRFGELVDPFDGLYDLEDGIIRTPLDPDITFSDDPLRMLRCIRFATQLNFMIDDETFEALERNAHRIKIISGERIQTELGKILMSKTPSRGFVDLQRCGLLQLILPEVSALDIVETRNGRSHKNNFYHTLEVLDNIAKHSDPTLTLPTGGGDLEDSPEGECSNGNCEKTNIESPSPCGEGRGGVTLWLRWAALLHDIGKTKTKRWDNKLQWTFHNHNYVGMKMVAPLFRRLAMPLDQKMKYVEKMVEMHMRPQIIASDEVTDSAVRRLLNDAGDDIDDLMMLCEADITSKNEGKKKLLIEGVRTVKEKLADLKVKDYKRLLQPCIDGNEIMELFNLKPSREVGILKQCLKDAVLDNKVENEREPLMALLKEKAKELGLLKE